MSGIALRMPYAVQWAHQSVCFDFGKCVSASRALTACRSNVTRGGQQREGVRAKRHVPISRDWISGEHRTTESLKIF